MDISKDIQEKVIQLHEKGSELAGAGQFREAIEKHLEAVGLLPEPKNQWGTYSWLLSAIGDTHFKAGHYEQALSVFTYVMQCVGEFGTSFIHLRMGQAWFELGSMQKSSDSLMRAYTGAGRQIFEGEDPKYLAYVEAVIVELSSTGGDGETIRD